MNSLPQGQRIILHCRPRIDFHLGHVQMLNMLHKLLSAGNTVTILLVPYYEHESGNATLHSRLREEARVTKRFYAEYLGYKPPVLKLVSSDELPANPETLSQYRRRYAELAAAHEPSVMALMAKHPHAWTSPNIGFVAKTLAAIDYINADIAVAGQKHVLISRCFDVMLKAVGRCRTEPYLIPDLLDLRMQTGMDRTDSASSFIELTDQQDYVTSKLRLLDGTENARTEWLEHFSQLILPDLPERLTDGIPSVINDETDRTLALIQLLRNCYRLLPYGYEVPQEKFQVTWSTPAPSLTSDDRERIRRLGHAVYASDGVSSIEVHKVFHSGKSGSTVLGVREFKAADGVAIPEGQSVLKVGDPGELEQERQAYLRHVRPYRTNAFTEVKGSSALHGGRGALAYTDAARYAGAPVSPTMDLVDFMRHARRAEFKESLDSLLANDLYQTLYSRGTVLPSGTLRRVPNEFWPAELTIDVDALGEHAPGARKIDRNRTAERAEFAVQITEAKQSANFARAYTEDGTKIDLLLSSLPEEARQECVVGSSVEVGGFVAGRRRDTFFKIEERAGLERGELVTLAERVHRLFDADFADFRVSAVHGDLHSGNVLVVGSRTLIIDYGKTRAGYPSLYDIATLVADLKVNLYSLGMSLRQIDSIERRLREGGGGRLWLPEVVSATTEERAARKIAELLEYRLLPDAIRGLGDEMLFYSLLSAIYIGRLKFDSSPREKAAGLVLARHTYERAIHEKPNKATSISGFRSLRP